MMYHMRRKPDSTLRLEYRVVHCGLSKERRLGWASASEPKNIEEERLGSLFLAGEVDPEGSEEVPPVLSLISSQLREVYYAKPQRRALKSFTESLRKGNTIFSHVPKKRNPLWLGRVHVACGSFAEGTLYFTLIGKMRAYLFRRTLTVDLSRRFFPEGRPHPTRLFQHIASGTLVEGDRLFFATPKILNTLYLEDIRHIVRDAPFDEIPRQIEMLYETHGGRGALSLIAARVIAGNPPSPPPTQERWLQPAKPRPFLQGLAKTAVFLKRLGRTLQPSLEKVLAWGKTLFKARVVQRFGKALQYPPLSSFRRILGEKRSLALIVLTLLIMSVLLLLVFRREVIF